MKKYINIIVCFLVFSFFGVHIYAHDNLIHGKFQAYCNFNGILKDNNRWSEEFNMLEEPDDYPNFQTMSDLLSVFMILPDNVIKACPSLTNYLKELVKRHKDNNKIKKEIKEAINYISDRIPNDTKQ